MKKILLTIGLAALGAASAFAQGYVVFSSSTQNISTNNTGNITTQATASGKTLGAGNFYYALFWSAATTGVNANQGTTSLSSYVWNNAGFTADSDATALGASSGTAGRFTPTAPNADGTTTVPTTVGGNSYYFVVVGWSANLGATLAQAEANLSVAGESGYIGQSAESGLISTGNGGSLPASNIMGGIAPQIQAFTLGSFYNPIPEPGTLALAAFGGASLLLFRRKK